MAFEVANTTTTSNKNIEFVNLLKNRCEEEPNGAPTNIALKLHQAVVDGNLETVEKICKENPECINERQTLLEGDSSLHLAVRKGNLEVFAFLLRQENIEVIQNKRGHNALDVAIATYNTDIALHISNHSRWRDFFHEKLHRSEITQLQQMVIKTPDVAESFLERCEERFGGPGSEEEFCVKYDFSLLYDLSDSYEIVCIKNLSDTIKTMVDHERIGCLTHPVCIAYLKNKWHRIGFWLLLLNLWFYMYVIFLCCITTLAILLQYRSAEVAPYIRVLRHMVLYLSGVQILKELTQIVYLRLQYFMDMANLAELLLYSISLPTMIVYGEHEGTQTTTNQLRASMAFTIFLAWAVLLLYMRRSVVFGTFIIMMFRIVSTLIKIIVLMLPFVCAYGIPFFLVFSLPSLPPCDKEHLSTGRACTNTTQAPKHIFDTLPLSLWTTFMLLLGEMKYPHTLYKYQPIEFPEVTYLVYTTFVLCMPIIIKNLMIGLSVGDVKRIMHSARQKHLFSQVHMVSDVHKKLPNFIVSRFFVTHVIEYPLRKESLKKKIMNIGFPDIIEQFAAQKENHRKSEYEEMGSTIAQLSVKIQDQETKINEILNALKEIKDAVTDNTHL